jgi:CRP-like cAMP-binding protein
MRVVVYVRDDCPFSSAALQRLRVLARERRGIEVEARDVSTAGVHGDHVAVTPTILFPNGARLVGTPDEGRLRRALEGLGERTRGVPNKVWFLEQNRLFRGVPLAEIERMAHLFREQDFGPKQIVFGEGDLGDAIYLLKTGHVRLYRLTQDGKEITLAVLGPGDVFGELALFDETRRATFAETMDAAHICAASIEDFSRLMAHRPQLTMMVAREIARRRSEAETRVAGMAYASVRGRITAVLRHLAEEHGEKTSDGAVRIRLRISHQELANLAGTTRETCTVELGRMMSAGLVNVDADHFFLVPNPERLQPGPIDRLRRAIVGGGKRSPT